MAITAQAVFQGGSGLPEDRFVNTFSFTHSGAYADEAAVAAGLIGSFYEVANGALPAIGSVMSAYVSRGYTVKCYNTADVAPRAPTSFNRILPTVTDTDGNSDIPEEVAICLSYRGAPPVTSRRRGRIYIGPLVNFVVDNASAGAPTRVNASMRNMLSTAALRLAGNSPLWCIHSRASNTYVPVVGGHIDDAFDTQRRRGVKPGLRQLWNVV